MSKHTKLLLRIVSSVVLFYLALAQVDWSAVSTVFQGISLGWLILHLLVLALERYVFSYKWRILLWIKGVWVPIWRLLAITLIGKFWGTFLPSSIGVDIVRGYYLYRERPDGTVIASSLMVDKVMGLWALLLLGAIGLLGYGTTISSVNVGWVFVGLLGISLASIYVLQNARVRGYVESGLSRTLGRRISDALIRVYRAILAYREFPSVLAYSFALSMILQIIRIAGVYTMAQTLGIEVPLMYYLVLVPVSMILIMLPLSVGGLGLREGTFVGLFALAGMSKVDAFALGFGTSVTDIAVSLIGGLLYLFYRGDTVTREA